MTARRPAPPAGDRFTRLAVRRVVGTMVVALFCVAAPAGAHAAPRPDPAPVWRNFPLQVQPSSSGNSAERPPTSRASSQTRAREVQEGRGDSVVTIQLAAIVLAVALVLVTIMAFFSTQVEIFRADGTRQTGVEAARDALQRAMTRVAPVSEAASAVGARARERIASAGAALKERHHARVDAKRAEPEPGAVQAAGSESPPDDAEGSEVPGLAATLEALATARAAADVATLKDRVDVYLESVTSEGRDDAELDGMEAKADGPSERSSTDADDELEVLRAKLQKPTAAVDDSGRDEVEKLKAKLAGRSGGTAGSDELKRKLTAQSWPVEGAPPDADAALKAKLRAGEEPSNVAAPDAQPPSDATPPPASVKLSFSSTSGKHRRSRRRRDQWFLLPLERRDDRRRPDAPGGERG